MLINRLHAFYVLILLTTALLVSKVVFPIPIPDSMKDEIDSLIKSLPHSKPENQIDILLELSKQYLSYSMDTSSDYAKLALLDAKLINDTRSVAKAYKMLGNIYYREGNIRKLFFITIPVYRITRSTMIHPEWPKYGITSV